MHGIQYTQALEDEVKRLAGKVTCQEVVEQLTRRQLQKAEAVCVSANALVRDANGKCENADCEAWKSRSLRCPTCPARNWAEYFDDTLPAWNKAKGPDYE